MSDSKDFISSKFKEGKVDLLRMSLDALKRDYQKIIEGKFKVSKEVAQSIFGEIIKRDPGFRIDNDVER